MRKQARAAAEGSREAARGRQGRGHSRCPPCSRHCSGRRRGAGRRGPGAACRPGASPGRGAAAAESRAAQGAGEGAGRRLPSRRPSRHRAAPAPGEGDLVRPGPGVTPPQLVSFPKAEYPPLARNLRVEGVVVVSVLVDENGQVQDVRMAEPIKQKVGINEAALSAARSARYKPATKEGVRVKMWTRLRIPFKL